MRVAIDIRKYYDLGIGTYIQNLVQQINAIGGVEFVYIVNDEVQAKLKGELPGEFVVNNAGKYSLKELFSIGRTVNSLSVDLFHSPHYTLPFFLHTPSVTTIHDIIHLRMRDYFTPFQRRYARTIIGHACRASDAVIVVSEFTKKDILSLIPMNGKKIYPIYEGVHPSLYETVDNERIRQFKEKHNITRPFILYTGSLKPHKNVQLLMKSFHTLRLSFDVELVIAGERLDDYPQLKKLSSMLWIEEDCKNVGFLPMDELATAYRAAAVVVLPSLYEGFGLSMLEGMASGVPVVGSNRTSIPEIVGDAGIVFDPHNYAELGRIIGKILTDTTYREGLIAKGLKRAHEFTWEQCARKTIEVYKKVIQ